MRAPDANWCVINPAGEKLTCYNLKKNYNYNEYDMALKKGTKPTFIRINSLYDLEGWVVMSPSNFGKAKGAVEKMISRYHTGELCK